MEVLVAATGNKKCQSNVLQYFGNMTYNSIAALLQIVTCVWII